MGAEVSAVASTRAYTDNTQKPRTPGTWEKRVTRPDGNGGPLPHWVQADLGQGLRTGCDTGLVAGHVEAQGPKKMRKE